MSAISLWNYLLCRIRLSPKTAEAFREGCAPILPLQAPSPGQAPSRHAHLRPSPGGPVNPACAQPKALLFTLASMLRDSVFLARSTWGGMAVTIRKVQLAFLSLLPPGRVHLSSCRNSACPLPNPELGSPGRTSRLELGIPSVLPQSMYSMPPTPTLPCSLPVRERGRKGRKKGGERGGGISGAVCGNKAGCSRQQNPSCRGEAAAFPTDNLMTLAHFHQPNLEHAVGI